MTLNTNLCPLCQQNNSCGAKSDKPCWCNDVEFPPELIEKVPNEMKRKSCICQQCAEKYHLSSSAFDNVKEVK